MKAWIILLLLIIIIKLFVGKLDNKKKKTTFLVIASLVIIFFMGCSHKSLYSSDLETYYRFYALSNNNSVSTLIKTSNFEIGYVLLNWGLSRIISWPQFIIIVEAIICTTCLSIFIYKNSDNVFDSIVYYLGLGIFKFQLTGFRQAIAMSICLLSIEFIKKKKFLPFLLIVLLASTFHKSAIIFLPTYFFLNSKFNYRHYVFLIVSFLIVLIFKNEFVLLFNSWFGRNYAGYVSSPFNGIAYIIIYTIIIIMTFISKNENINKFRIPINMCWIALMTYIVRYTVINAERLSTYFAFGALIALPNLYNIMNNRDKNIIHIIFVIFLSILFLHKMNAIGYNDYMFFWQT